MSDSTGIADILERVAAEDHKEPPLVSSPGAPEAAPVAAPEDDAAAVADRLRRDLAAQTTRAQAAENARVAAERRANEATTEAAQTRQSAAEANFTTILSALDARTRESEALTAEMAAAGEAGDFRKVAEIGVRIGRVGAALEQLESAKQEMERRRSDALREPVRQVPQPVADPTTTVGVPRETFYQQVAPNVAEFLRENDRFFTDQSFYHKCVAADGLLRADGITPTNPDYIPRVKEILGMAQPTAAPPRQQQRTTSAPPAAAPPSHATPSMSGRPAPTGDIYISAEDRKLADWMGIDAAGMVSERERLKSAGEIPHRRR
ncbi:MAG TPA: hypothetical protein VNH17_03900 [Streptosporangiaceae bacterium]|nr:hypothetical protein [Streptosporangiaceae bacterium]